MSDTQPHSTPRLALRLPRELAERLRAAAAARYCSVSEYVRDLLRRELLTHDTCDAERTR